MTVCPVIQRVDASQEPSQSSVSGRFLAYIQAGNLQFDQAQDSLHHHAFQTAAGVRRPLLTALVACRGAQSNYEAASTLAASGDVNQRAVVLVSRARLQSLLADIILTLDAIEPHGERSFQVGELAAARAATEMATEVIEVASAEVEPLLTAAAEEILAHRAFRACRSDECLAHANKALADYQNAGPLARAEGIHRLLGLYYRRQADVMHDADASNAAELALNHFVVSLQLAEQLRSSIPPDPSGLSHAAFFARRAYVNEQVIDLLVAKGDAAQALCYAEQAKARSLREVLAVRHMAEPDGDTLRTTAELLARWPAGVAAIEYFLGTEKAWLFAVDTSGTVQAWDLLQNGGRSQDLVADVRRFLDRLDTASTMRAV